jgi:predicted N-formylglutamate amidohydrolase
VTLPIATIPEVIDVAVVRGAGVSADAPPDLVIEIPHGATRTDDYASLAARLTSPLPANLVDFFHVNTDAGAPELGLAIARGLVADTPTRTVAVLRCRIPRTFIDCNRRMDATAEEFRAGKVTPGLMPWITSPEDRALLRGLYDRYVAAVRDASALLTPDGAMVLLHTYAPRTIDVEVDHDIVANLRRAYLPGVEPTWPLRPEVDVISRGIDGTDHAPRAVVDTLRAELAARGIAIAEGATYPLHPSTLAWDHVMAHPDRAICVEVRRDLLADPFEPFAEMTIGDDKVDRLVPAFVNALRCWW